MRTTVFFTNGLFLDPNTIPIFKSLVPKSLDTPIPSIAELKVQLPEFYNSIQNLALPMSHFNWEILEAYDLVPNTTMWDYAAITPRLPYEDNSNSNSNHQDQKNEEKEEKEEKKYTYNIPVVHTLGRLFSFVSSTKVLYVVLDDEEVYMNHMGYFSAGGDSRPLVEAMGEILMFWKRDWCGKGAEESERKESRGKEGGGGEWDVPAIRVWDDPRDDDDEDDK